MKSVASGFRYNADLRSAASPEFRTVRIRFDAKFLNVFKAALQFERGYQFRADDSGVCIDDSRRLDSVVTDGILIGGAAVEPDIVVLAVSGVLCAWRLEVQLRNLAAIDW